jgi:hypothetical protein
MPGYTISPGIGQTGRDTTMTHQILNSIDDYRLPWGFVRGKVEWHRFN